MEPGAAFTNPTSGKLDQQRKILEELERQKKLVKSGGAQPNVMNLPPAPAQNPGEVHITTGQRTALDSANKASFGFFIPQERRQ